MINITSYHPSHQTSWLRCRVLGFLDTCYYDDVWATRPDDCQIQLVALEGDQVVGILDIEIADELATIATIVVHPDHRRSGIADRLLSEGRSQLPGSVTVLDAWTREDESALAWYRRHGFVESEHYLHVHKSYDESDEGFGAPERLGPPVLAFCHAQLADQDRLRAAYQRVYVCCRFSMLIGVSQ